ncbi:hypothetical protein BST61_g4448 [Cercospora zeina]
MRSFQQLVQHSIRRPQPATHGSDKLKRQDSCVFDSEVKQQQQQPQQEAPQAKRTMVRSHKPASLAPTIPAFQVALSKWSPPVSPGTASPASRQAPSRRTRTSPARTPSQIANSLFVAACAGDLQAMRSAISHGASVNSSVLVPGVFEAFKPAKSGQLSPLAGAASNGQLAAVEFLIANGAEISPCTTKSASSPLHQACRSNSFDIVSLLLEHGADVDIDNAYKVTPTMYACKYSSKEIISLLLQHRPNLNKVSHIGSTALSWAVFSARPGVAELLLRARADPNQTMPDGNTALYCAILTGSASMVKVLLRHGADPFVRNEAYETPLQVAQAHDGNEQIVAMLKTVIAMWQQRR